ncbi:alpha/beta-hydrolase [Peniophora sp. CONT]|nr:alpha/beta-hydrolase [Peniophora sp. CONT]
MSCEHCIKGVRHEGTPEGTYQDIAGVKCYIATPSGDYDKSKVVIYLTDAFGIELVNNLLLADDFARNGYKVVAPDLFEGEPMPADLLDSVKPTDTNINLVALGKEHNWDFQAWASRHGFAHNLPRVRGVIDALKADGVARVATTGYCFGGHLVFDIALAGVSDVSAASHPSALQVEDFSKYVATSKAPLLINACEIDFQHGKDKQEKAAEVFKSFAPGFLQTYSEGCAHGFAVRGDMSDPKVKAGKERAFNSTVEWFKKYL